MTTPITTSETSAPPGHDIATLEARILELSAENTELRGEIRVARRAADLTAELVVQQFEETEAVLSRLQVVNAQNTAVLEAASEISIIATDLDGRITLLNRGAEELLGIRLPKDGDSLSIIDVHLPEELHSRSSWSNETPGMHHRHIDVYAEYVAGGRSRGELWTFVRSDGTRVPVSLSITALRGAEGQVTGYLSAAVDLTPHQQAEQAVRRAVTLMQEAIAYSPVFVWETDAEGRLTFVLGGQKVLGYATDEILGRRFGELRREGTNCQAHQESVETAVANREAFEHLLSCVRSKDGDHLWISMSAHPIVEPGGEFRGYRGVNVDVTELTLARQALEEMALHDQLTGLSNRRKLYDRFRVEIARLKRLSSPLSLLLVDIDRFKSINDQHGHLVGDDCLRLMADLFVSALRESDLVARFGGEEFIVLLPETGLAEARLVAEKLRETVQDAYLSVRGVSTPLRVTVCVGVAEMLPDKVMSLDDLIERADRAAYQAKAAGRNSVVVYEGTSG